MVVGVDPFYPYAPKAMPGVVAGVCGRSPACHRAHPHPARDFARFAKRLRHHPVTGVGTDSSGATHRVTVTENLLSNFFMYFNGAHFTGPGELAPAASALRHGDRVPLMRLASDNDPANGFGADLREFSNGHSMARSCVDAELVFDKEAPARVRVRQYAAAYAAEPDFYGVVSKRAWAAPDWRGWQPYPCISSRWEDRPMYPAGARVRGVPTLVLGGEYDLPVPEVVSQMATRVMVDSTYVGMTAAGHDPQFWSDCGPELVQRFYRDLDVGDTSCADQPAGGWWVPGSFPTQVRKAPPATQTSGPHASRRARQLATVTAWTVMDSVQHNFFVPGDSVGLRGGVVDYEFVDDTDTWTLEQARFARRRRRRRAGASRTGRTPGVLRPFTNSSPSAARGLVDWGACVVPSSSPSLALVSLLLATGSAPAIAGHHPNPAIAELVGFASLPADTFVPGSEPSGYFTGNAAAPFPGQPVQGFSGIHALGDGSYLVMSDNGFGAKANSQDFRLPVHRIKPDTGSETVRRPRRVLPPRPVAQGRRGPSGATAGARPRRRCPRATPAPPPTAA